jgi:Domain of unknown function (DUF3943)
VRIARAAAGFRPGALILGLAIAPTGFAQEAPSLDTPAQQAAPTAFAAKEPAPVLHWGTGDGRSFAVPAYEIFGEEFVLNRFDHYAIDKDTYPSQISNFEDNQHKRWVVDNDKFATNQFLHPYQGTIYQGFARSAGLGFWESSAYTMGGSLLWEYTGESTTPSINDQVATGIGGLFLGETLFRMASLLLESSSSGEPGFWREFGAAVISPATGLNRLAFGKRFGGVFPSYDPAVYTRFDLGASLNSHYQSNVNVNADLSAPPAYQTPKRYEASATFTMSYGLPGKADYEYTRPFDYFNFEFVASSSNTFEAIFSRGLLVGTTYEAGLNYRGIWGLYGTYDYVAPQIFRVSNTGLALGTTAQLWISRTIALQGTGLLGAGYGGGGVIHGSGIAQAGPLGEGQRDYHYGMTPQAVLALRVIFGDRVSIDVSARDYFISKIAASESTGTENIGRADLSLTVRVFNLHGVTLRYEESRRDGTYASLPTSHQTIGTVSIGYTLLGQTRAGAVDWRPAAAGGPVHE